MSFILFGFVCLAYMVFATVLVMKYDKFKFKNRALAIWVAVAGFLILGSLGAQYMGESPLRTLSSNLLTLSTLMFIAGMAYPKCVGMARRQVYYVAGFTFVAGIVGTLISNTETSTQTTAVMGLQSVVILAAIALLAGLSNPSFVFAKTRLQGLMFMLPVVLGLQAVVYFIA